MGRMRHPTTTGSRSRIKGEIRKGSVWIVYKSRGKTREVPMPGVSAEAIEDGLVTEVVEILTRAADEPEQHLSGSELEVLSRYKTASSKEIAKALAESAALRTSIEAKSLTTRQVAKLLGVEDSRIRQRLLDRTLAGFKERSVWHVYGWQFIDSEELPGIHDVNKALRPDIDAVVLHGFFTSPNVDLVVGGERVTPLQWLQARQDPQPVADVAATL